MATNFDAKAPTPPSFVTLAFQNRIEYRYVNKHVCSINDAFTSCKNFVNSGPVMWGKSPPVGTGFLFLDLLYGIQSKERITSRVRKIPSNVT